ncbi:AfsR/SARP family transcriptional regulator [Streptosporangium sandarakinum]|uniref:AfsR/SARP family transcriptional regulator n=1 Tax=Streptosporangium sandarakinum TaxID=1260955 RepID=UPI0037A9A7AF
MPAEVEFRLLGPLEVRVDGISHRLGGPRQERLLAALLLNPDRLVTMDVLIDVLWEENPPDTARRQLHNAINLLRRGLNSAHSLLFTERHGYGIRASEAFFDVALFEQGVDDARRQARQGERALAIRTLSAALDLWRGPALAGLTGQAVENAAAKLNEQRLAARETLISLRLADSEGADLIPELTALVAENPLRESLRHKLISALYRAGRQSEALAAYEEARVLLATELGVDPGPDLRTLHSQILRNELEAAAPPPEPPAPSDTLPYEIADFIGRAKELERLLDPADGTDAPTVVITSIDGMPGVGKTALAVRAAHLLAERYPDGRIFVDLHGHTPGQRPLDPAAALDLLLRSIRIPPELVPHDLVSRAARWRSELAHKRFLVVLDNAENDAQVRPLLAGTAGSSVLITSRRRLAALEGATSLSLDVLTDSEARELFRRIAGPERTEDFPDEVGRVVTLCGFLPLAIRIAASRFRHRPAWTLAYLVRRLSDERRRLAELSAGDRSVMAAFTVSYRHLGPAQQQAFRLLGLHPGPDFDEYGLAALMDVPVAEATDALEGLLDVHLLIQHDAGRFHFHDLIAQYARMRAEQEEPEQEREAARRRLDEHLLNLGLACERLIDSGRQTSEITAAYLSALPDLSTPEDVKAVIAAEHRTIAAVTAGAGPRAYQLAAVLGPLLLGQGYADEALSCYAHGIEAARAADHLEGEALLCRSLGLAYINRSRFRDALRTFGEGLAIEEARGNAHGAARMLANMGIAHIRLGEYADALSHLLRASPAIERLGTPRDRAALLGNLGVVYTYRGRYDEAADCHLSALELNSTLGNQAVEVNGLMNVGWAYTRAGRLEEAMDYLQRALTLSDQVGAKEDAGRAMFLLADCLRRLGCHEPALEQARSALIAARAMGSQDIEGHALLVLGLIHHDMGEPNLAEECLTRTLTLAGSTGQSFKQVTALDGLGKVAASRGHREAALTHWRDALEIADRLGLPAVDELKRQIAEA